MIVPKPKQAIAHALNRLERELSPKFSYHNYWHTKEDVLIGCQRVAKIMGIGAHESELLEISAVYHDIGFVESYLNHELVGTTIAAQSLSRFGFSDYDIERVSGMIMATRLPQSPQNVLEEILADADLDVLGRPDFFSRNACLWQELANFGNEIPLKQWYEGQLAFLEGHTYFTSVAKKLRDATKQQNILALEAKLLVLG
ncbi:MAG: HD domain-containing protein [Anaerolineales bacterium]|nr:HD domain-containing protein [Anaerolineales bacterium]MCB8937277.1 HD domain-containing protein [Ardenticatenaceae bacterium]